MNGTGPGGGNGGRINGGKGPGGGGKGGKNCASLTASSPSRPRSTEQQPYRIVGSTLYIFEAESWARDNTTAATS